MNAEIAVALNAVQIMTNACRMLLRRSDHIACLVSARLYT